MASLNLCKHFRKENIYNTILGKSLVTLSFSHDAKADCIKRALCLREAHFLQCLADLQVTEAVIILVRNQQHWSQTKQKLDCGTLMAVPECCLHICKIMSYIFVKSTKNMKTSACF